MNGRDLAWRFAGALALTAAGGISLIHRQVLAVHVAGPATGIEWVLGLLSFVAASFGVLLLIQGARLHEGWVRGHDRVANGRRAAPPAQEHPATASLDSIGFTGGRIGLATYLSYRATQSARRSASRRARPIAGSRPRANRLLLLRGPRRSF